MSIHSERPVFVLGSGRCGSTLVQSILNSHPDFLIWGEHGGWVRQVADAYYRATKSDVPGKNIRSSGNSLPEQIARMRTPGYFGHWDNHLAPRELVESFRGLIQSVFAPPATEATRWGFKEIRYCIHPLDRTPEFLLECFPRATFLIVVRNPWETVFSMLSKWWRKRGEIDAGAIDAALSRAWTRWDHQYSNLFLFQRTAPHNSLILRFEDVLDPVVAGALFARIGANPAGDILPILRAGGDGCVRDDDTARRIRERMSFAAARLAHLSRRTRLLYGYESPPSGWA